MQSGRTGVWSAGKGDPIRSCHVYPTFGAREPDAENPVHYQFADLCARSCGIEAVGDSLGGDSRFTVGAGEGGRLAWRTLFLWNFGRGLLRRLRPARYGGRRRSVSASAFPPQSNWSLRCVRRGTSSRVGGWISSEPHRRARRSHLGLDRCRAGPDAGRDRREARRSRRLPAAAQRGARLLQAPRRDAQKRRPTLPSRTGRT